MRPRECIAMLLAGGQGNRLGILTKNVAKPAVPFGGKYRIIDFTLSNCINSGIDTVGVLTQYRPLKLNAYIGNGQPWDMDMFDGGVSVLPPYMRGKVGEWYKGTANAIYQNIEFVEQYNPVYVIVLSGDHIYKMDYSPIIEYHKEKDADATIGVIQVPWEETSRFGIMNTRDDGSIYEFEEKPRVAKSNKASMGIYVFTWDVLKKYLCEDEKDPKSSHDFGKNIIPRMLLEGMKIFAYPFNGYWKDVGTIQSLWEANMDLLEFPPKFNIDDPSWRIYSRNFGEPPHYIASCASVKRSIIGEGCMIYGDVEHSVIFSGVYIKKGAVIRNSIIMPNSIIEENAKINCSIIAEEVRIGGGSEINYENMLKDAGGCCQPDIVVIGHNAVIKPESKIGRNMEMNGDCKAKIQIEPMILSSKEEKAL